MRLLAPAALALLLGSDAPLTFRETETAEPEEPGDPWLTGLVPLRDRKLRELTDRARPLQGRLERLLLLALEAQGLLEVDRAAELAALAEVWEAPPVELPEGPGIFPRVLEVLSGLEALDGDWRELLRRAETAEAVPCRSGCWGGWEHTSCSGIPSRRSTTATCWAGCSCAF